MPPVAEGPAHFERVGVLRRTLQRAHGVHHAAVDEGGRTQGRVDEEPHGAVGDLCLSDIRLGPVLVEGGRVLEQRIGAPEIGQHPRRVVRGHATLARLMALLGALHEHPRIGVLRAVARRAEADFLSQPAPDHARNVSDHRVLQHEDLGDGLVECTALEIRAARGIDQPDIDVHLACRLFDTAAHQRAGLEGPADAVRAHARALVRQDTAARDHVEILHLRELRDQTLGETIRDVAERVIR